MTSLKQEKYGFISKIIAGWLILDGVFFIFEAVMALIGSPVIQAVTYDKGFETMRSGYGFSSFLVEAPILIIAGVLLWRKTSTSWLVSILALAFMFHEFVFAFYYYYNLEILNQLSFDYLGYLILIPVLNIPSIFYLYKHRS